MANNKAVGSNVYWTSIPSDPDVGTSTVKSSNVTQSAPSSTKKAWDSVLSRWSSFQAWRLRKALIGWKFGVDLGLLLTLVILLINVAVTASVSQIRSVDQDGKAAIMSSDCVTVKRYNTAYHLFINIFSTLLIGASNYSMQCLCAPTRTEIDRAHNKGRWLDIGVPSIRNLKQIRSPRLALWFFLGASSLPLHLFFNSAVFVSLHAHSYDVYTIQENFLRSNGLSAYTASDLKGLAGRSSIEYYHDKAVNGGLVRISGSDCITEFATNFQTNNDELFLVRESDINAAPDKFAVVKNTFVDTLHTQAGIMQCPTAADTADWMCRDINTDPCYTYCASLASQMRANASNWAPFGEVVDHCLVNRADKQCDLDFSVPIMGIVIIMNVAKAVLMGIVGLHLRDMPIITLGDAVASFLRRPDASTTHIPSHPPPMKAEVSSVMTVRRKYRHQAVSRRRWWTCMSVCAAGVGFVIFWLVYAYVQAPDKKSMWTIGIGAADPRTIIYTWSVANRGVNGVIQNALVANLAQPILSMIYFTFNGLFTAMMSASEWDNFARDMKGLRVSGVPLGAQRSTHFLQLPYRYGIPLMVLSMLLHWLISLSIFVVSVYSDGKLNLAGVDTDEDEPYYVTCGYSPGAMAGVIGLGVALVVYTYVVGYRRLKAPLPITGSNSKLIADACRPGAGNTSVNQDESSQPVQWGKRRDAMSSLVWYGFSSLPVTDSSTNSVHGGNDERGAGSGAGGALDDDRNNTTASTATLLRRKEAGVYAGVGMGPTPSPGIYNAEVGVDIGGAGRGYVYDYQYHPQTGTFNGAGRGDFMYSSPYSQAQMQPQPQSHIQPYEPYSSSYSYGHVPEDVPLQYMTQPSPNQGYDSRIGNGNEYGYGHEWQNR